MSFKPKEKKDVEFVKKVENNKKKKDIYSPHRSLYYHGYKTNSKIATTIQGSVYSGYCIGSFVKNIVIKRANKQLHMNKSCLINNQLVRNCHENIVKEYCMNLYLQTKMPPNGFVRAIDFFEDERNLFLIMEHKGECLLDYILKMQKNIEDGKISAKSWRHHIRILFHQMILFVDWLHNKCNVGHLDISLENILISNVVFNHGSFKNHGQIYFVDFGVSIYFDNNNYSTKFVGKKRYMAPNILHKKKYDVKKADIWSLGVCLFTMLFGMNPFKCADISCPMYVNICNGYLKKMLIDLNKLKFISHHILNLLQSIFIVEEKRINLNQILQHKYLKKY